MNIGNIHHSFRICTSPCTSAFKFYASITQNWTGVTLWSQQVDWFWSFKIEYVKNSFPRYCSLDFSASTTQTQVLRSELQTDIPRNQSRAWFLKLLQNKKCQKNLGYPRKKQSFYKEKDCFFLEYPKFFWPFLFWSGFTWYSTDNCLGLHITYLNDIFCFKESIFQWQIKLISYRSEFWLLRRKSAVIFSKLIFFKILWWSH